MSHLPASSSPSGPGSSPRTARPGASIEARQGLRRENPALSGGQQGPVQDAPACDWTPGEVECLLAACRRVPGSRPVPPWLRMLVELGYRTGLGLDTLLRLEWRHLDLELGELFIPATEVDRALDIQAPLAPEAVCLLRSLEEGLAVLPRRPPGILDAVGLPESDGGPDRDQILRRFERLRRRARLRPGGFASLRHAFAVQAFRRGASFLHVANLADWTDLGPLFRAWTRELSRRARMSARERSWAPSARSTSAGAAGARRAEG